MTWMTFVVAGFNPTPPTALDIQARSTQDLSYGSMNSTAVALAANIIGDMMPSPIVMPVTGNEGSSPTPTVAVTLRAVSTVQNTSTPFSLLGFLFNPTATRESRPDGPAPTSTPVPTFTPMPTSTLRPTSTPRPTSTRIATRTPTPTEPSPTTEPTDTLEPTPTKTELPTNTPEPPEPSSTPELSRTPGRPPTGTDEPTVEPDPTSEPIVETPEATQ
ncbi:MAG TPA: hypothetical protein VHO49_19485 [Anaerolineales bacterium]|nr:hypothetical protein [Anaerolineales bacterium]